MLLCTAVRKSQPVTSHCIYLVTQGRGQEFIYIFNCSFDSLTGGREGGREEGEIVEPEVEM